MCCVKEEYLLMKMHCNSWMQIREGSSKIVTTIFHSRPPILYVVGHQEPILQLASVVGDLITNELCVFHIIHL